MDWAEYSDEELIQQLQQGQVEAFEALFHRYKQPLLTFLARYTGDAELAEDLFQQAFLKLYEKADSYQGTASVKTWLFSIAVNAARDQFRKDKVRKAVSLDAGHASGEEEQHRGVAEPESPTPGPLAELQGAELQAELSAALSELDEEHRAPFVLARVNGMSYAEVAEALELTVATVRMRVHRAHHRLAGTLARFVTAKEGSTS